MNVSHNIPDSASSPHVPRKTGLFPPVTLMRLALAWGMVIVFMLWGGRWLSEPLAPLTGTVCFLALFATIITASFGVVRQADQLAHQLGEPYGTLILTLSIVTIEVILIAAVMLGPGEFPTIGRDAIFAVMMIILNLVVGICLIAGGLRYNEQEYNLQGAMAYLAIIVVLTATALVLPNHLSGGGRFTATQAVAFAAITAALYALFLAMQMRGYRRFFIQPDKGSLVVPPDAPERLSAETVSTAKPELDKKTVLIRSAILVGMIVPIVLLSHDLAVLIDYGIAATGAPVALSGVLIAIIVFTPESITAIRASLHNEGQRSVNLCLGAFVSTVGLTVPAVLIIGLVTGKTVIMGITPVETVLFLMTVGLGALTFMGQRTSPVMGVMHVFLFVVFGVILFAP